MNYTLKMKQLNKTPLSLRLKSVDLIEDNGDV